MISEACAGFIVYSPVSISLYKLRVSTGDASNKCCIIWIAGYKSSVRMGLPDVCMSNKVSRCNYVEDDELGTQ